MAIKPFRQLFIKYLIVALVCPLTLVANSSTEKLVSEKRIKVAMRMIGHEVLLSLGDSESRVMPVETIGEHQYKIPFEFEFGFDPDDIISIVDSVVKKTGIADNYLVEVEQCETKEVVHSFEIGNTRYADLIACKGRTLPEDCYSLLVTILDHVTETAKLAVSPPAGHSEINPAPEKIPSEGLLLNSEGPGKPRSFKFVFITVPVLLLIGFITYSFRKNKLVESDPDLIQIGTMRFDKRNMVLSSENQRIELSGKEAELLAMLHARANRPVKREDLLQKVWGDDGDYIGRTLDVFISRLRKKLEADESVKIVNIRGIGYKLVADVKG